MIEVGWYFRVYLLWSLHDVLHKLISGTVGNRQRLIVSNMFGNVKSFFRTRDGNVLLLDLSVDHAGLELVIDGGVGRNSFLIKFLLVFTSSSQILKLGLIKTPLFMQNFFLLLVHSLRAAVH